MTKPAPANYDAVADSYNQRMPKMHLAGIDTALQNLARQVNAQRVRSKRYLTITGSVRIPVHN